MKLSFVGRSIVKDTLCAFHITESFVWHWMELNELGGDFRGHFDVDFDDCSGYFSGFGCDIDDF